MQQYASFGTPQLPAYYAADEVACFKAGRAWAAAGKTKLPRIATVQCDGYERRVPVVRSRHEFAKAFIRGWKVERLENTLRNSSNE